MTSGSRRRCGGRRGFTLVELLVVIAIIGLLMALLLPAVQSIRETARRLQCSNNLKQIGAATLSHIAVWRSYPSAGWGWGNGPDPNAGYHEAQPASWAYNLLAYMEQVNLRNLGSGLAGAERNSAVRRVVETALPNISCPSRRPQPATFTFVHAGCFIGLERPARIASTDYAGCAGTINVAVPGLCTAAACGSRSMDGYPAFGLPAAERQQAWERSGGYPIHVPGVNDSTRINGVMGILGLVREDDVPDGASNTFLVGERRLAPELYATSYCENDQGWTVGFDWDNIRWTAAMPQPDYTIPPGVNPSCQGIFGSAHPTSVGMAMCDGAVRTFRYDVSPGIFRPLGSRNAQDLIERY